MERRLDTGDEPDVGDQVVVVVVVVVPVVDQIVVDQAIGIVLVIDHSSSGFCRRRCRSG